MTHEEIARLLKPYAAQIERIGRLTGQTADEAMKEVIEGIAENVKEKGDAILRGLDLVLDTAEQVAKEVEAGPHLIRKAH